MILQRFITTVTMDNHNQSGEGYPPSSQKGNTMKVFMIEHTLDGGVTKELMPFNAENKSKAALGAYLELPLGAIIIDVFEIQ